MIKLSGRHWLIAFTAAVTVHVGILCGLLWQVPNPGAKSAGFGGIDISLGPAGGAAAAARRKAGADVPTKTPPQPSPPVATRKPIIPEQEPDASSTAPANETDSVIQERTEPETPVSPITPVETEVVSTAETEKAPREITRREPDPKPPEPVQSEPPPAMAAEAVPEPSPVKSPVPPAQSPSGEQTASVDPSASGADSKPGLTAGPDTGRGDATSGGGSPGAAADYAALIRAWLERHKQYPRRAQLRRLEGTALLYFVMNHKGQVLNYRVQQSSGSAILDREVKAMIERAKPLPEMPQDMHQARLELIVPVTFSLR